MHPCSIWNFTFIICDELHLLLRVMEHLIQALIDIAKVSETGEAHKLVLCSINGKGNDPKPTEDYQ